MAKPSRHFVGLLVLALVMIAGTVMLRAGIYGWTLFVVFPMMLGGFSAWAFHPATEARAAAMGALTAIASAGFLLFAGLEGLICIAMSLPLVMPLGALGALLVYHARRSSRATPGMTMLLLLPTATLAVDVTAQPRLYEVRTAITVAASPEQVWKQVVAFAPLPEPQEWFFRAGVAYPQRARIAGSGPGAVRYCEFSTGAFVEPIEVWDEPRLLRFGVTANPAPLQEWSIYGHIVTKHLHGYLVSRRGEFRLTRLANGHTLLEGTTWYQHGLWPAEYWRWWSDAIIHRIHLRVLTHVRTLAEQQGSAGPGK